MQRKLVAGILLVAAFSVAGGAAQEPGEPARASEQARQVRSGRETFDLWCAICHSPGVRMGGTQGLQAKYGGRLPAVLTERTDLTVEFVEFTVRTGVRSMPPTRKTEISDGELRLLAQYLARTGAATDRRPR